VLRSGEVQLDLDNPKVVWIPQRSVRLEQLCPNQKAEIAY